MRLVSNTYRNPMPATGKGKNPVRTVSTGGPNAVSWGPESPLALMAGPCVIESRAHCLGIAKKLAALAGKLGIPLVFKASFDKANRSSIDSWRGPGIEKGLEILAEVREKTRLPVVTDVHEPWQAAKAAEAGIDVLQIPAFLCRQTDLLLAAGETGRVVNVKKMQGMAPEAMAQVVRKVESTGNRSILLTERGESFGYGNLVADMRNLMVMRELGYPVVFDATHSVQRPGALGTGTGGDAKWAPPLARAAVATGACDGLFLETHENPAKALSDGPNSIPLRDVGPLWKTLRAIAALVEPVRRGGAALAAAFALAAALAPAPARGADNLALRGQSVTDLRMPLQRHENGRVKELLCADAAWIDAEGLVHAEGGVRLVVLDENGGTNGVAAAVAGVYDPKANSARCTGPVHFELVRKGVTLDGTDFTWRSEDTLLQIEKDAVLVLFRGGTSSVEALSK